MGVIAIVLLGFEVILMFMGEIYFDINIMVIILMIILIINVIYLAVIKKLSATYRMFKKWFKGEVLERNDWKWLYLIARKLLVVNYFLSIAVFIIFLIAYILMGVLEICFYIPFEFSVYIVEIFVLFNGIIMGPTYILLGRKIEKQL